MKRRQPISRRTFIKLSATIAAGAALAGCSPKQNTATPTEADTPELEPTVPPSSTSDIGAAATSPSDTQPSGPEPSPTTSPAYLAVAHGPSPEAITYAAIEALGGMTSFVKEGSDVIIKPNICVDYHPPEYAATTNPAVVAALVSTCAWMQALSACG